MKMLALTWVLAVGGLGVPAVAETGQFGPEKMSEQVIRVQTAELSGHYGLLLRAAQDRFCRWRRFVVLDGAGQRIGATGPLLGGQVAMVPLVGMDSGAQVVTIRAQGCAGLPVELRLVRLQKASPDLGSSVVVARARSLVVRLLTLGPDGTPEQVLGHADSAEGVIRESAVILRNEATLEDRRRCDRTCRRDRRLARNQNRP